MRTPSSHRRNGRHSKGARDKRMTDQHYDSLHRQAKRLERELVGGSVYLPITKLIPEAPVAIRLASCENVIIEDCYFTNDEEVKK